MSPLSKKTSKGLGRGIDELLPQSFDRSLLLKETERIQKILVDQLEPNPNQPRKSFDKEGMDQLAGSIKQHGVLQPIIVTPSKTKGNYIIIAGERRWRAARAAGLKNLPAIVRTSAELQRLELAIVENVQRVDLSPLEQAESIERLHEQFNLSYTDIANRLGKSSPTVNNLVRLLQLPMSAAKALDDKEISEGHARAILGLRDDELKQKELLSAILRNGWSVRQAERFVVAYRKGATDSRAARAKVMTESPQTKRLSSLLGTAVSIRRMAHGGKLEIGFSNEEELSRITKRLLKS